MEARSVSSHEKRHAKRQTPTELQRLEKTMTTELATIDKSLEEKVVSEEEVYSGRLLHVVRRAVHLPDGRTSGREMILHPGASAIVVLDDDNCTVLERQWRCPLDRAFWEIPAGKIDKGEDPLAENSRKKPVLRLRSGLSSARSTMPLVTATSASSFISRRAFALQKMAKSLMRASSSRCIVCRLKRPLPRHATEKLRT